VGVDLRFEVFNLIYRDRALRALLLNYAGLLDGRPAPEGTSSKNCFLALQWADDPAEGAVPGSQVLTARAHMPRDASSGHWCPDDVLQRLRAVLESDVAVALVAARCTGVSPEVIDLSGDTTFTSCRFEIAPVPSRSIRRTPLEPAP